jgi:ribosomal protein S18 acetylase RimI-like enzyme
MSTVTGPLTGQGHCAETILRALPGSFGIEEAIQEFIVQADRLPTFVAHLDGNEDTPGAPVGFLTLRQHSPEAAEITVMGVLPEAQRQGVGRALVAAAEAYLRTTQTRFLQVKTLSARHPDPGYAKTRRFYKALGFCPLEEWEGVWDADNPCLQLIKYLHPDAR